MKAKIILTSLLFAFGYSAANGAPVVVTPGSLAGYTYFPPATSGGSGGAGAGDEVSTLQRCVFTPERGDQTVTVRPELLYGYTKPIPLNFVIVGGDGGNTPASGGGGSSAILLNTQPQIIAPGADGGARAVVQRGRFNIKGGDVLRFVTGGGGGNGFEYVDTRNNRLTIGGGGGAGFKGGGGGGSHASSAIPAGGDAAAHGKGGSTTPGQGGRIPGGVDGTSGNDFEGGISTYPEGSTAPNGVISTGNAWLGVNGPAYIWNSYFMGGTTPTSAFINSDSPWKYSATALRQGSPSRPVMLYANGSCWGGMGCWSATINRVSRTWPDNVGMVYAAAGGGGSLGRAGYLHGLGQAVNCQCFGTMGQGGFDASNNAQQNVVYGGNLFNQSPATSGPSIGTVPRPGLDMALTLPNTGATQGANPGQIVVQYQAPVCGLLQ